MSTERNVEQYCEDYADEHGLSAVTDHQYAMRLKAENAKLKKQLFNIADTYRLHTSDVNANWAKVAITMSHMAKEWRHE